MDTWMFLSIMLESVTVATYWTPTFQFKEKLWKQITLDPSLLPKVCEIKVIFCVFLTTTPPPPNFKNINIFPYNLSHLLSGGVTALLPSMVHRRSGHIVVISSVQGKIAIPSRSACKFSLHGIIREQFYKNTCCNCVKNARPFSEQMQHPSMQLRHFSTVYGQKLSRMGSQWRSSAPGTSKPTCQSMLSPEMAPNMEVSSSLINKDHF